MKHCVICNDKDGKYKCPICLVYYCSVTCCNKHRQMKCKLVEKQIEHPSDEGSSKKYEFETADTVPIKKLKLLETDKDIKNCLNNPHLRNLLKTIDTSKEPEEVMQKAMLEPIFVEFADACLKVVEPRDDN
ncbi:hypothetical protein ILUMI_02958 [Ignelater luminosus]|uniref:Zinc finger HIT domain-containing protein 3 n=1 Tax=Ignelater luminosus TaxID=2038154 RepID=A0A8K0DH97_IGNLU|nr:hypothetical protein ILUMI_02958 [Ignelater luminosus]